MATSDLLPAAIVSTGTVPAAIPQRPVQAPVEKDHFASQAGPDVSFAGPDGVTQAYAVFSIDPDSKQLHVMVVDGEGRVLRSIPPSSVAQMMESMGRYRPT